MKLMRLIADLEPEFNNYADFLTFPRVDTRTRDWRAVDALKKKFVVHEGRSKRQVAGWPLGPNAVAMDAFRHVYTSWLAGGFPYEAAFLIEADGLPLRRTWIKELVDEWKSQSGLALGHWDGHANDLERGSHMNGNMMFHPKLIQNIQELAYGEIPQMGWDMKFWPKIKPFATPSKLIYSDYRLNTPKNPLRGCPHIFEPRWHSHQHNPLFGKKLYPCYLHGIKGLAGIECVRSKFLVET